MKLHYLCSGIRRRDFIKAGVLGSMGISLAGYLRLARSGELESTQAKSAIFINLAGGPSHLDTFDMKPQAPSEYRGEFSPIPTNVPGIQFCEHLPKLAHCTDLFAILRGVSHSLAAHALGTLYMNTGNRPIQSLSYPGYGAVVSKERPGDPELPAFVAIPDTPQSGGYLGVQFAPLQTNAVPVAGKPFSVRGIAPNKEIPAPALERRQKLLSDLDTVFNGLEKNDDLISGLDEFSVEAYQIITSPKAREAFDLSQEPTAVAERFGKHPFGQSCLLAVRLVAAGVRFVTVNFGGWDTHSNNFEQLKNGKLAQLDDGLSATFTHLAEQGLLESTSVFVTGEFGRTPKINPRAGRDHWPQAMVVLLGGGGMKGGQVIGASDDRGMAPVGDLITPEAVAASFYHSLGIDFTKEYRTPTGRPVMIVREGRIIQQLFS